MTSLLTFVAFFYYNSFAGGRNSLSASSPDGQAMLGLCLLFSAGTFLFTIAAHILPEIQQAPSGNSSSSSGSSSSDSDHHHGATAKPQQQQRQQWGMLTSLVVGILAPLLFSSHNHGH